MSEESKVPGVARQKSYVMDHIQYMNREIKISILGVVMREVGDKAVLSEKLAAKTKEVDIDLDRVAKENPEALLQIYNIVKARIEVLNQPAGKASVKK